MSIEKTNSHFSGVSYNPGMTKDQAIKHMGSIKALAELLGVSQAAVSQWKEIPQQRIWQLRVLRPEWFNKVKQ